MTCVEVQQAVESMGTDVGEEVTRHAAACQTCAAHLQLARLLASVEPAPDTEAVSRIVVDLPLTRWQLRRVATWAPLAAGVALTWSGLIVLGGVPAGSAFTALFSGAGEAVGLNIRSGVDALVAARGSSEALRTLVATGGTWLVVWLFLTGVGGGWLAHALSRRQPGGPSL